MVVNVHIGFLSAIICQLKKDMFAFVLLIISLNIIYYSPQAVPLSVHSHDYAGMNKMCENCIYDVVFNF